MTFTLHTDRALVRAQARSTRYLLVSYTAPEAPARAERVPVHVALVLDRSGSMEGARKFELARQAVEQALRMLREEDRFTLVVYDDVVDVLTPLAPATRDAKRRAMEALHRVEPRASTDLHGGWSLGCSQLLSGLQREGIARVLLLTDGLANHGITDPGELMRQAGELRRRGVVTSTFGVGDDFDERLLRDMAHEGGGNFYFVESPRQIPDLLTSELGEALEVVVRGATLEVEATPGAEVEPLNRFRSERLHGDHHLRMELGDLVSGQEVRALVRVRFARGQAGDRVGIRAALGVADRPSCIAEGILLWTYAGHPENDAQPRDASVDREVAVQYAARARVEAAEANRMGDFDRARRVLERTAARIGRYAGEDREMRTLVRELTAQVRAFGIEAASPMMLKSALFVAESTAKGRSGEGRARRRQRE